MQEGQDSPGEPPNPAPYAQPCSAPQQYFGSSLIFFLYFFFCCMPVWGRFLTLKKTLKDTIPHASSACSPGFIGQDGSAVLIHSFTNKLSSYQPSLGIALLHIQRSNFGLWSC